MENTQTPLEMFRAAEAYKARLELGRETLEAALREAEADEGGWKSDWYQEVGRYVWNLVDDDSP